MTTTTPTSPATVIDAAIETPPPRRNRRELAFTIIGWLLTLATSAMLIMSATFKLQRPEWMMEGMRADGWKDHTILPIGIAEIICTLLFIFPRTAILGGVLLAGYLGGAIATHVRQDTPFIMPAAMGVIVWLALILREPRLRALIPWRIRKEA